MSDMTSTEKKRRLILFSLLGVALVVSILLASFFLFTPEKPSTTARLTSTRRDTITGKAERMKMRRDHLVPLNRQTLAVLEKLRAYSGGNQYVFPSYCSETIPFGKNALSRAIRRMGFEEDEMCPHGFRAMASPLLNELGYNRDWIERQLAHAPTEQIHRIYNRAKYLPERRRMLQEWADYLDGLRAKARQVPALSFSWEIRRSRHPAWTGISVCPGCVKGSETSSPATTPSGHSTSPLQSLSVMSAGRSGGSIKRNEGDRRRKRKTPEKGGRRNGKNWNGSRGNAGKQPLPALPGTGFPC